MKLSNSKTAVPFEDLLIEAYENKDDRQHLDAMLKYVSKHRKDYCLVCICTLRNTLRGYLMDSRTA